MADQIIDACCLINLYASGSEAAILQACGGVFISDEVRAEALTIRQPDPGDPSKLVAVTIDLSDVLSTGLLRECRIESEDELDAFVKFATMIDDGEASCLALAQSRGWIVATDDRKAIRIATESGISVITTPELVQRWIDLNVPDEDEVVEALRRIERFASFRPHRSSPLHGWWDSLVSG